MAKTTGAHFISMKKMLREPASTNQLRIRCRKHPRYNATRAPKEICISCSLLFILRYQHSKEPDKRLGGLDPYQFIGDTKEAAEGLEVWFDEKLKPPIKLGTPKKLHLVGCPASTDELLGCNCAQLRQD